LPQLHGAKCFSVAEAMSGFTNILLDHESCLATTFHTSFGRYRWLRLPYGVSSGPQEYQAIQQEALVGLLGTCNIAEKDHDGKLYHFLLRMREVKLKLNPTKWTFKTGFQLSSEGLARRHLWSKQSQQSQELALFGYGQLPGKILPIN